jgi:hypothetical protein
LRRLTIYPVLEPVDLISEAIVEGVETLIQSLKSRLRILNLDVQTPNFSVQRIHGNAKAHE